MIILYSPFEVAPKIPNGMVRISVMAEERYLIEPARTVPPYVVDRYFNKVNVSDNGFRSPLADVLETELEAAFQFVMALSSRWNG